MKTTFSEKFGLFGAGFIVLFVLAMGFGWILNIAKLVGTLDGGVTAWMIARTVGVFAAPLGAVLGYL